MGEIPTPSIDYSSRSYAEIRQSMLDAIESRLPEWTSRSPNDFGIVLIELFATMGDILSYTGDRVANEAFIETAQLRQNILRIARMLGYRPQGTAAATTKLEMSFATAEAITIPAGYQIQTASAINEDEPPVIFSVDHPFTFSPDVVGETKIGSVTIDATHGVVVYDEVVGVALGVPDEAFYLLETPVVESSVVVRVQVAPTVAPFTWKFIDSLLDASPIDFVYTTREDANGVQYVVFGDGVNGRLVPRSASVLVSYRVGGGDIGNVGPNTLIEFLNPILGLTGAVNPAQALGGADAESNASIRISAPRSLQALRRAVTVDDYAALALQVPKVAKARAEAEVYSNVALYIAPNGGGPPTQALLNSVHDFFLTKKLIGVDLVALSPSYVPIDINATVTVQQEFAREQVRDGVQRALAAELAFDIATFGMEISMSRSYTRMFNVAGASNIVITEHHTRGHTGAADIKLLPNEIPVLGTVNLTMIGGVQGADPTTFGYFSPDGFPSASTAPEVVVARNDTNTMHLSLHWLPGTDTSYWIVQIDYLDGNGEVLSTATAGSFTDGLLNEIDTVKNTVAEALQIRTQAFSAASGPAYSPYTAIANPCRSTP